jgi:hypothetical protein
VNWQQFRAFVWLRFRLRVNQVKRAGTLNTVILAILTAAALATSLSLFVGAFFVGPLLLHDAKPFELLALWDVLAIVFLFIWCVVLLADLQRSEVLSLEKILHLPVSPRGAFLINYLSSLFNLRLILLAPALFGLAIGLALAKGPPLLLALPLLTAFLFAVTALTNQFQGWLAAMMTNPRRRRAMFVFVTLFIVLIGQVPSLIVNVMRPLTDRRHDNSASTRVRDQAALLNEVNAGRINAQEYARRSQEIEQKYSGAKQTPPSNPTPGQVPTPAAPPGPSAQEVEPTLRVASMILPPGWLGLGIADLVDGSPVAALLGTAGLALIGAVSLSRSYRTTLRLYTGQFRSGKPRAVLAAPKEKRARTLLLEWRLPGVPEPAAAVALASVRWLIRAPEAKLMLLGPIIMAGVFGSMLLSRTDSVAPAIRPFLAFGAMGMALLGTVGFLGNQFGFDRGGFRVYVLSGVRRRDILLGKNLAMAPVTLGFALVALAVLQCFFPMSVDLLLSVAIQFVATFLLVSLLGNLLSILSPMQFSPGTMRPVRPRAVQVLFQVLFSLLFPLVLAPALLPLGIEMLMNSFGVLEGVPICLLLTLIEGALVVLLYHFVLGWEGALLQLREQKILEVVTPKAE